MKKTKRLRLLYTRDESVILPWYHSFWYDNTHLPASARKGKCALVITARIPAALTDPGIRRKPRCSVGCSRGSSPLLRALFRSDQQLSEAACRGVFSLSTHLAYKFVLWYQILSCLSSKKYPLLTLCVHQTICRIAHFRYSVSSAASNTGWSFACERNSISLTLRLESMAAL